MDTEYGYTELDYNFGGTIVGISDGEGDQDASTAIVTAAAGTNEMGMIYLRHQVTGHLTAIIELQQFESGFQDDYDLAAVGMQLDFRLSGRDGSRSPSRFMLPHVPGWPRFAVTRFAYSEE